MNLKEASYTIFDFETTGLYPYSGDRICEIGAIRTDPGDAAVKKFQTLVYPERPISHAASRVNGITDDMVSGKPRIAEVLPEFMSFVRGSAMVAYNTRFDLGFLECALDGEAAMLDGQVFVDALPLARQLFLGLPSYSLGSVAAYLGINTFGEHRAMKDASMTMHVFKKESEILWSEGVREIAEIEYRKAAQPVKGPRSDKKLLIIEKAIKDRSRLCIHYRSEWSGQITVRVITPKLIQRGYEKSYVVAYCHLRNDNRNFHLDNIIGLESVETGL